MKTVNPILLALLWFLFASSPQQIRYFLNEHDFISDHSVPQQEILQRPHLRAEYDRLGRLERLVRIDTAGQVNSWEQFSYRDSSAELLRKDLFQPEERLVQRTIFGPEPRSREYIEYVYGVDSVQTWGDRFTTADFNPDGQERDVRFYDVDAFQYGSLHFKYDSSGRMTSQEWVRHPSEKVVRKWLYGFDPATALTRIMEYDSNGVLVMAVNLSPDGTEALFTFLEPADSADVNHTTLAYQLEADLEWGRLAWSRLEGTPTDTKVYELAGPELETGAHRVTCFKTPTLQDSARYSVLFQGRSRKGYPATERSLRSLNYDISPPALTLEVADYILRPEIVFYTSEPLTSAILVWDAPGAARLDSVPFTARDLERSGREAFILERQPDLVDGVTYEVHLSALDRAGNRSLPLQIDSIHYDVRPPVLSITSPHPGAFLNHQRVSFSSDEDLQSWWMTVKPIGSSPDEGTQYRAAGPPQRSPAGGQEVDLADQFQLVDGGRYNLILTGMDLAGNPSEPVGIDSITFDLTPPLLTMIYPYAEATIKDPSVSYALSEPLSAAEFRWTHTGGGPDSAAPHLVPLSGGELEPVEHIHVSLTAEPILSDGSRYTLTLSGRDRAGNESEPITIRGLLYDATIPQFTRIELLSGAAVNQQGISYEISEDLESGTITWTRTGGSEDPNSPQVVVLVEDELKGQYHADLIPVQAPLIQDGSIYRITFQGADRAGNQSPPVTVEDILYDFTSPELVVEQPQARSISSSLEMIYTLSEDLVSGRFRWMWLGGHPDTLAPHQVDLAGEELQAGRHQDHLLINMPELVEDALYTLTFTGHDRAGNRAGRFIRPGLRYDFSPPTITVDFPHDSLAVNHRRLSYTLSEALTEGTVTWEWSGGAEDTTRIHRQHLSGDELSGGEHIDILLRAAPILVDGSVYRITFSGYDAAGNSSNQPQVRHLLYDVTTPQFTVLGPAAFTYVASPALSYQISESLQEGSITYNRTSGTADPDSPHRIELTGELAAAGRHDQVFLMAGPELVEGGVYAVTLEGSDRAGNQASIRTISGLIYDATPPELAILEPVPDQPINAVRLRYYNSEQLQSGYLVWTRTGGAVDTALSHLVSLHDRELKQGEFNWSDVAQPVPLEDGAIYRLEYFALDPAGNRSDTVTVTDLHYDVTPPVISILDPPNDVYRSGTNIQYNISEDLTAGRIEWTGTGPEGEPHSLSFEFTSPAANAGEHGSDEYFQPDLVDGGVYTITLNGTDRAGNQAPDVNIRGYRFDHTAPVFSDLQPETGSYLNAFRLAYRLSEDIVRGTVIYTVMDDTLPVRPRAEGGIQVALAAAELTGGLHPPARLLNQVPLQDGSVYSLQISGVDYAGNRSDTVTVTGLHYDVTPPVLTLTQPDSGEHVRRTTIGITINEPLTGASLVWTGTDGQSTTYPLRPEHLGPGELLLGDYAFQLVENRPYILHLEGADRAGNESVSGPVPDIRIDTTPPVIMVSHPVDSGAVNRPRISFHLSEDLSRGKAVWMATAGHDPGSPHQVELVAEELLSGDHQDRELANQPDLVDSMVYTLELSGTDWAGNEAALVQVPGIQFDTTPPAFLDISPTANTTIRELEMNYRLTEDLAEGRIIYTRVAGEEDAASPHILNLAGKRLRGGPGGGKIPPGLVSLVNGAVYEISFHGIDPAGNQTSPTNIQPVGFDNQQPVLFISDPPSGSFVNYQAISYLISEDLAAGQMEFEHSGGIPDSRSPLRIELGEQERKMGEYTRQEVEGMLELVDGARYNISFTGRDEAGNEADPSRIENVTYDTTAPVFEVIIPLANSEINHTTLSYALSEDLHQGSLTLTWLDGAPDPRSPQLVNLVREELIQGRKDSIQLSNGPVLVNGARYRMEWSGEDHAGNPTRPRIIENVRFDNEPPVVSITVPIDGEQIKNTAISYILSENLATGAVIFTQTGGTRDSLSPQRVELGGEQLGQGMHTGVDLALTEKLADGGKYSVSIVGHDRAGNQAEAVEIRDVFFDLRPPQLALTEPSQGSAFNTPQVTLGSSEALEEGLITFTRTGGVPDPASPHQAELKPPHLSQGEHSAVALDLALQDGSIYSVSFDGSDLAGNSAETVTVSGLRYDVTNPAVTISRPLSDTYTQSVNVTYSLSEGLGEGYLEMASQGGSQDPESPHRFDLTAGNLAAGEHGPLDLNTVMNLNSGTRYRLTVGGSDPAGNQASPAEIDNLTLDLTAPILAITSPAAASHVNHTTLGIRVGEILDSAWVSWERSAGSPDPSSPHRIMLPEAYHGEGNHADLTLPAPPELVSGAVYRLSLVGVDRAGNAATVSRENIHYDVEPPIVQGHQPLSNTFINGVEVSYELNEPLQGGTITWITVGGKTDPAAPRRIILTGKELKPGLFPAARLTNQTDLNDGTVYEVSFTGVDSAGNSVTEAWAQNVTYDVSKPVFTGLSPSTTSRVNSALVSFTVNEDLTTGSYTWKHMGGDPDPAAPHEVQLPVEFLSTGSYETGTLPAPPLNSGTMYRITFSGEDRAGNVGQKLILNVVYDDQPPELEIVYPPADSTVNGARVAYRISEQLQVGRFVYTWMGETPDPNAPHQVALSGKELETEPATPVDPINAALLQDGSRYRVEFEGTDLAGNSAQAAPVENVTYDITRPEISISEPLADQLVIGSRISYALSEDLRSGSARWVREGGNADPKAPHQVALQGQELTAGEYTEVDLLQGSGLVSGTTYSLTLVGSDRAGNESAPATVRGVEYVRFLDGNWNFQGEIMTVVWTFETDPGGDGTEGKFAQGVRLGTKIDNQEFGRFKVDYSSSPWVLEWAMDDSDQQRVSLLEFADHNHLRVVTGTKKPRDWSDGEVMTYEFQP